MWHTFPGKSKFCLGNAIDLCLKIDLKNLYEPCSVQAALMLGLAALISKIPLFFSLLKHKGINDEMF